MPRRLTACGAAVLLLLCNFTVSSPASAADWPNGTIRLIVPYPPGGGTDIVARMIAKDLSTRLGVAVVVDNRGGASGRIGTTLVAHAAPDGNTILFGTGAELTMAPATARSLGYDPLRDLQAVTEIAGGPYVLIAAKNFAPSTLVELVAEAQHHPGAVNYSSGGIYSASHMMGLQFAQRVGIDVTHVPYQGSGPSLIGLMSGEVQYTFNTPSATLELIRSGKVKAIAVASSVRLAALPNVPTISESGYPGFVGGSWYGLLVPRGTPKPIVDRLAAETVHFLAMPDTESTLDKMYIRPIGSSPVQFRDFIAAEIGRYKQLMNSMHLAPN
jgi:tripartite-type tricarboxylate transporter receptor subunit TctC